MSIPTLCTIVEADVATVQDGGRPSFTSVGVPRSGAWHRARYRKAVALIDAWNSKAPAIELLAGGLVLEAHDATAVAVTGPAVVHLAGERSSTGAAVEIRAGQHVRIQHQGPGPVYVAVAGWQEPLTLGSCSTDTFSRLGGRVIRAGQALLGRGDTSQVGSFTRPDRSLVPATTLRVIPSGDPDWCAESWTVGLTARSGTRLVGPLRPVSASLPSRPTVVGAVQLTPAGEAIILGPDGGLTGGYPTGGAVITADLDRVSELLIGSAVRFLPVDVPEAVRAFASQQRWEPRGVVRGQRLGQEPSGD